MDAETQAQIQALVAEYDEIERAQAIRRKAITDLLRVQPGHHGIGFNGRNGIDIKIAARDMSIYNQQLADACQTCTGWF